MPAADPANHDQRQRELEQDVKNTAKASVLHLDALVKIERHLWGIKLGLWMVFGALLLVFFAGR